MRIRNVLQAMLVVGAFGAGACSKPPSTAPKTVTPPAVVPSDYEYDVRFMDQGGGYTVKRTSMRIPPGW
jgi:hypothetical protein